MKLTWIDVKLVWDDISNEDDSISTEMLIERSKWRLEQMGFHVEHDNFMELLEILSTMESM